jgi:putative ubiquitin-RnfH superfamily antitoxin RatB of RatAB toxin-antitoxin module
MPSWKQLYDAVTSATSLAERRRLIEETQLAIAARVNEIAHNSKLTHERLELDNAAATVNILLRVIESRENNEAYC